MCTLGIFKPHPKAAWSAKVCGKDVFGHFDDTSTHAVVLNMLPKDKGTFVKTENLGFSNSK